MGVYRWATAGCEVVAVQSGIGEARAAAGAARLIDAFAPQILISFGFAGGLVPNLGPGTIVIGTQLMVDGSPERRYQTAPALVEEWWAAANAECFPAHRGTIVTVPRLVADPLSKAALAQRTGACAVDMESAGIVTVAQRAALPCGTLRAVVDTAEEVLPVASLGLIGQDGRVDGSRLMRASWHSPGLLRDLWWLARRTATARRHLGRTLTRWTKDRGQGQRPRTEAGARTKLT
jgi:adenosylhomocysteine nucleosidase